MLSHVFLTNYQTKIIYINSVSLSVTKVLGGGGRERPVKQRAISSVSLFVEVLKLRSCLSVCRGPETQIPNCKSKITAQKPAWLLFSGFSWNPAVLWGFFEITRTGNGYLILIFFQIPGTCDSLTPSFNSINSHFTNTFFSGFSWNPAVLWGFFEITRTGSGFLILNLFQIPGTCDSLTPNFNSFNSHFTNTQTWRLFNISNTRPTLLI